MVWNVRRKTISNLQFIKKIDTKASLADLVYDRIREGIVYGHIEPRERLNQLELAREFDVSERTVREALTQLVSEGLVTREPYKEFRAVGLSAEEIEEIFHMRALLEGWAMELAVFEIRQEELDRMLELLPEVDGLTGLESVLTLQETKHREFHWIAISASKKGYLIQMLKRLWDLMLPYSFANENLESYSQLTRRARISHAQLVDALAARDGLAARTVLVKHSEEAMEQVRMQVKRLNRYRARDNGSLFLQRLLPIRTSFERAEHQGLREKENR